MMREVITHDEMLSIPAYEISDIGRTPSEPLVSILVITYNHEEFIKETIEGILAQQCYFPIELIIGEDKSQDRTLSICLNYQKRYPHLIRVLTWDKNLGPNANFLRCWGRTRGKYVAICEGDDYWIDPLKLTKQVALMEKSPNATLCGARARILDNFNQVVNSKIYGPDTIKIRYLLEDVIRKHLFHTSTYLLRPSAFEVHRQAITIAHLDSFLQHLCAIHGEIVCIPDIVSVYRHHDAGFYSGSTRILRCERDIAVYQTVVPLLDGENKELMKRRIDRVSSFLCHELIESGRIKEARRRARSVMWRLGRHDPLRALLVLCHILLPRAYNKLNRFKDYAHASFFNQ